MNEIRQTSVSTIKRIAISLCIFMLSISTALACAFHGGISASIGSIDNSYIILANVVEYRKSNAEEYNSNSAQMVMFLFKKALFEKGYEDELDFFQAIEGHYSTFRQGPSFTYELRGEQYQHPMLISEMDILHLLVTNKLSWTEAEMLGVVEMQEISDGEVLQELRKMLIEAF